MIQNEYGKLKKVLVGREFDFPQLVWDITFRTFFQDHLDDLDLVHDFSKEYSAQVLEERNEDLDNLAKTLERLGVEVYRPRKCTKAIEVKTPHWKSWHRASANVRDQCFIYKNTIIETPPCLRGRYFENDSFRHVLRELSSVGYNWIQAPLPSLSDSSIDDAPWDMPRDYGKIPEQFEMFFDAANLLKVDDRVIFNYSSYNHYLGVEWLRKNIDAELFSVRLLDNHIDGALAFLDPETVLINPRSCLVDPTEALPWLKKFRTLRLPRDCVTEFDVKMPHLASPEGMSINILMVDPRTALVNSSDTVVAELLDKNGFNVILVQLRYCQAFGGGVHCSTLDLDRD